MPEPVRNRMKQDRLRRETQEKYERSLFTPAGVKTFRLQPSIDNTSIMKYQSRPSSTASSSGQSPRHTSTPHPPAQRANSAAGRTNGSRTQATRSIGTQTSLERAASAGAVREKPPAPDSRSRDRPGSSLSNHSVTYSSRSASCQPTRMYQSEDIRTAAKLNRPPSKVYLCQEERDRARSTGSGRTKSPSRFDGTAVELPGFMKSNYFLHHGGLSMGQKQYIWGVARIYSVTQLMSLKQRQYQNLLDYEFSRRIQNKELKEHERVKEWKDYQRYSKFIKRYEQRIPRNKLNPARSPCEEASHVHKHMIKGWTTNPYANEAYRPSSRTSNGAKRRQTPPDYHPDSAEDTGEQESDDNETEQYRLRLIILPGENEKTGTEGESTTESEQIKEKNSADAKEDSSHLAQDEHEDSKESLEKTEAEEREKPEDETDNYL
ncbi:hypothetical protein ACROYT_G032013 [Oculina patagonica]